MNKNEIVARFMGGSICESSPKYWILPSPFTGYHQPHNLEFNTSYDWLMPAWVKFRDLKFESVEISETYSDYLDNIAYKILRGTITEAFDELVKGIEWYETIKQTKP